MLPLLAAAAVADAGRRSYGRTAMERYRVIARPPPESTSGLFRRLIIELLLRGGNTAKRVEDGGFT
jgi:hypothetical protein